LLLTSKLIAIGIFDQAIRVDCLWSSLLCKDVGVNVVFLFELKQVGVLTEVDIFLQLMVQCQLVLFLRLLK